MAKVHGALLIMFLVHQIIPTHIATTLAPVYGAN